MERKSKKTINSERKGIESSSVALVVDWSCSERKSGILGLDRVDQEEEVRLNQLRWYPVRC